jgi:RNA 3'-terminal phosphate cyclase
VLAEEMTGHAETNISVIETFLGRRFETQKTNGLLEIRAA